MENLQIYEAVREVPRNAKKEIQAGRLKGKTDINPMWRIKCLTEQFGPCGIGWKYTIDRQWTEAGSGGEICAFCNITLYVKVDGSWSDGIPGTGGSMMVAKERGGLYTSDECYKMALTDAISVSCKTLGMGADVYWEADRTKYDPREEPQGNNPEQPQGRYQHPDLGDIHYCQHCGEPIRAVNAKGQRYSAVDVATKSVEVYGKELCWGCMKDEKKAADAP